MLQLYLRYVLCRQDTELLIQSLLPEIIHLKVTRKSLRSSKYLAEEASASSTRASRYEICKLVESSHLPLSQKQQNGDGPSDSDSSSEGSEASEDEDESDDPTGVNALIAAQRREAGDRARAERKAKKVADRADAARMAEGHRKKDINLNNVTTISGFGGGGGRTPPGLKDRECYKCGGKGHLKHQCPQADRSKRKRDLT